MDKEREFNQHLLEYKSINKRAIASRNRVKDNFTEYASTIDDFMTECHKRWWNKHRHNPVLLFKIASKFRVNIETTDHFKRFVEYIEENNDWVKDLFKIEVSNKEFKYNYISCEFKDYKDFRGIVELNDFRELNIVIKPKL